MSGASWGVLLFWRRATAVRRPRVPAAVWVPSFAVAAAMALPVAYLALRALGAGMDAVSMLLRFHTVETLLRTVALVGVVTVASVAIAVPYAWLTTRTDLPLRRMWSVLAFLPLVLPSYVAGFLVVTALGPRGLLQQMLAPLGVERLPEIYGFPGAAITLTLLSYPYVLLSVRSALAGIDPALEEASRSMGRSSLETIRRVTIPLLQPSIMSGALLVALYTVSDFGAVSLLRYETFTWSIYTQYEAGFDRASAAALSLVLVALAVGILYLESRVRGRGRYYRSAAGSQRTSAPVRLRRWRWPALALCTSMVGVALVAPLGVLAYWLTRGVAAGEPFLLLWGAARNSLYASGLAAVVIVAAGFPVALLIVRYSGRMASLVERMTYTGFALPGIVIALALVFFGAALATPLYQTMGMLVLAYLVLFLAPAVGALRASLLQVSPRLEEAGRSMGRGPVRVFTSVTLPLVRPGALAGAALVFLLVMKELPATLILSPIGFKTLATSVWSAASEAYFAQAAAPALLLIGVSAVPMVVLTLRGWGRRW